MLTNRYFGFYKYILLSSLFAGFFLGSSLHSCVYANSFYSYTYNDLDLQYFSYKVGSDKYNLKIGVSDAATDLHDIMIQNNAVSGINGVFFCPADYRECKGNSYTINERFVNGQDLSFYYDTGERGVFGWDIHGGSFIHKTGELNPEKRDDIYEGLGNFPILFEDGQNLLEGYIDNGLYDKKMRASLPRHFICSNKAKDRIIFGRSSATSLEGLTHGLYAIGCWDALNLDAGGSAQMIYNGRYIVKGNRDILDGIFIQSKSLNSAQLYKKSEDLFETVLLPYLQTLSSKKRKEKVAFYLDAISIFRQKTYEKYSGDVVDENGIKIGYKLEIYSNNDLKKMFLLNSLEKLLKEYKSRDYK